MKEIERKFRIFDIIIKYNSEYSQDFPWRTTKNPFWGLIAEIMLQKTSVKTALKAYYEFTRNYFTPLDLVKDETNKLEKIIFNIGIHSRANRIRNLSEYLVKKFNNKVPCNKEELMKINGIGEYTSNAFLVNIHNENLPLIDTNIRRLLIRTFGDYYKNEIHMKELLQKYINSKKNESKKINFTLLDFSMVICKFGKKALCETCPIQKYCRKRKEDNRNTNK